MLLYEFGDRQKLTELIQSALLDPRKEEIRAWATKFQTEAEENLQRWIQIVEGDPIDSSC
jgi:hypothetical protein